MVPAAGNTDADDGDCDPRVGDMIGRDGPTGAEVVAVVDIDESYRCRDPIAVSCALERFGRS